MTDPLRLSVSKTKTFLDCKKKFDFSYIQKLPKKDWDFHVFGKFCHKVLEEFHQAYVEGCTAPYNITMGESYKKALIEYKDKMTADMKKDCWAIINKYLYLVTKDKNLVTSVIGVEKKFDFAVNEKLVLNGMIDKIQIDDDGVIHVADYKTTKNKKYLKDDWFQLLTYAYVILNEDPKVKKVRASYILLRHDFEYLTTEFKASEIRKVKDKYLDYVEQINSETEFAPNPTMLCNYCDFQNLCPAGKAKSLDSSNIYGEVNWT